MSLQLRHQLTALDRALMNLLDERARLVSEETGPPPSSPIEDLLARSSGDFPGEALRSVMREVDSGCATASRREGLR
ncbi:MAG: hypothetical protein V3T22_08110 [Planctomycetota bacterium]